MEKKTHFVRDFLQNSIGNSSTSTTCNPIYIAWTILQLQITMEFCRPHMHEKHLKPHLHCGTDPRMIRPWSENDPTTHETVSHPSHRRGRSSTFGDGLCMEKHRVSCICYLSKTHFVRDFLQNSIGNSSTSTTCNPIYIAWTILQLQITMEFCRPHMHEKHLKPHLQCGTDPRMIRPWSENDPTTHETVSHPSHRRGRSSTFGDGLCMEKHRVSCICYLSKTHFVRDFLQNSIGNSSTSTTCNPIYIAWTILQLQITMEFCRPHMHEKHLKPHLHCGTDPRMIRPWSENDPTTHETVSHPSHRRGRSSTFGDGLCMEKHRVSCICYLSKTHFVRDFLQNSIGNSSTSTTCNPIYIAWTILQLQITMEFCRPHMHEKHLKPHLQCGTDPRMIREWSDHDPRMIRPHTRPSRTRRTAEVDHRRSGTDFVWKNTGFRASAISQKRISCETSFKTPSATHPPAPLAIPFTLRERSYSCKSQWNSVDRTCTKNTWNPIYNAEPIREWSDHDPRMIRPHTRPSRTRRTAEVDHRRSGTDFVWKNTGFRASAISQKRISCETSFKTPSATHPPAPLAIPFTLREQFLWLTRSLTNSFFANSFFALSLTNSFFANSFFDYLIYPD